MLPLRSCALLLHARVPDPEQRLAHRLPLHRLVDHSALVDGGILPDSLVPSMSNEAVQHEREKWPEGQRARGISEGDKRGR